MENLVLTGRIEEKRDRTTTDDLCEKSKRADDKQLQEQHNYKWDLTSSKEQEKWEHHDRQRLRTGHLKEGEEVNDTNRTFKRVIKS